MKELHYKIKQMTSLKFTTKSVEYKEWVYYCNYDTWEAKAGGLQV